MIRAPSEASSQAGEALDGRWSTAVTAVNRRTPGRTHGVRSARRVWPLAAERRGERSPGATQSEIRCRPVRKNVGIYEVRRPKMLVNESP